MAIKRVAEKVRGRMEQAKEAAAATTQPAATRETTVLDSPPPRAAAIARPAAPPREARPPREININLPAIHPPANLASWIVLGLALATYGVSIWTTDIFVKEVAGAGTHIGWAAVLQLGISALERYLFAGVFHPLTIAAFLFDGLLNGAGIFIGLLPRLLNTSVVQYATGNMGVDTQLQGFGLFLASYVAGLILGYVNDRLFFLATSGRR